MVNDGTWTQLMEEPVQGGGNVEKRKARCIMATDTEWRRITERAGLAGLTISRFAVQRLLEPAGGTAAPSGMARQVARDLRVLVAIEEQRFRAAGAGADWDELVAGTEAALDSEEAMG